MLQLQKEWKKKHNTHTHTHNGTHTHVLCYCRLLQLVLSATYCSVERLIYLLLTRCWPFTPKRRAVLEKQGLHHAEPILEEYGVGSETDVLKTFKLCEHPEIRPQIDVMKTEVMTYQAFARLTPSSHSRKGRIARGRTLCTLICGSQTLQRYQHSRTCCVQCWPTHQNLARLSVSLMQGVSRSKGEGEEWVGGLGSC